MPSLPRLKSLALAFLAAAASLAHAEMTSTVYRFAFDGYNRDYIVAKPSSCTSRCPVMFDLHGFAGTAHGQRADSGQLETGDRSGYLVVYPDGVQRSWNAGSGPYGACCGLALDRDIDDVAFLTEVARRVAADYPVDRRRVYISGLSNGCAMAQRMAAQASHVFAAESCSSLYLLTEEATLPRPVAVTEIHAIHDNVIPYRQTSSWTGVANNFARWAALDRCVGDPVRTFITVDSYVDVYEHCAKNVVVRQYTLAHSGHDTYQNGDGVDVAQVIWDSVKDFRLRGPVGN